MGLTSKKKNFWDALGPGFLALAPMAGITDLPFRLLCKEFGADVVYSEMVSAAALFFAGRKKDSKSASLTLSFCKSASRERPFVVQLFGREPEHFFQAAQIVSGPLKHRDRTAGVSGIDINFGCPVPKVRKQGAGAELMRDLGKSRDVVKAVLAATDLPVSIKVRTRSGGVGLAKFLDALSGLDIKAVMVHGRSLSQQFSGPIDFKAIRQVRDYFPGLIIANGGLGMANPLVRHPQDKSANPWEQADFYLKKSRADGLGLAQGVLGRPWLFREIKERKNLQYSPQELAKIVLRHARLVDKYLGPAGFLELRKHLSWYFRGQKEAKRFRVQLLSAFSLAEIENILRLAGYLPAKRSIWNKTLNVL